MSGSSSATAMRSSSVHELSSRQGDEDFGSRAGPWPTAIWPPWASTIRLAIAMPRPVPLVLVVKNGSKMRCRCSGDRPGPLSRTAIRTAGRPSSSVAEQRGPSISHRIAAGGQGVLQDVAKDLLQAERIDGAAQVDAARSLRAVGLAALARTRPGCPRPAARCRRTFQTSRSSLAGRHSRGLLRRAAADGPAPSGCGRSGPGPRAGPPLPRQHFQAGLAAGQGVAALVGQAGHHLADGRQPFGLQRPAPGRA